MIYKSSYFAKELRQVYPESRVSLHKKVAFALFTGLIAFVIYFIAQPLKESVLMEAAPVMLQPSYFSTLIVYIHAALILNTLFFIFYYDSLFFHEVRQNSWYLLVKMGYNPAVMIFSKLTALLLSTVFIYTLGFGFTVFLTFFLKFNFVSAYFPTLYLAGLIDLFVLVTISMMVSPFIKTVANGRYVILFLFMFLFFLKSKLGFFALLTNRVAMQNLYNLFDLNRSGYLPVVVVIILVSVLVGIIKAHNLARYYNLAADNYEAVLPAGQSVVLVDDKTGRKKSLDTGERIVRRRKIFDGAVTAFLIVFIIAALSINIMILVINASTFGREVSIHGVIPYIFKSNTMKPAIMPNDLAYFAEIDDDDPIAVGEIILFEENHVIYVERVTGIVEAGNEGGEGTLFQADIDYYPPLSQPGAMIKEVKREAIFGVYSGRNRWLGALILFANTIFGRLLFLLAPAILLFYHKTIADKLSRPSGPAIPG